MAPDSFAPGAQFVHIKMRIIGTLVKAQDDIVHAKAAENKPLQIWKIDVLAIWNQREELQKKLSQDVFTRGIFEMKEH